MFETYCENSEFVPNKIKMKSKKQSQNNLQEKPQRRWNVSHYSFCVTLRVSRRVSELTILQLKWFSHLKISITGKFGDFGRSVSHTPAAYFPRIMSTLRLNKPPLFLQILIKNSFLILRFRNDSNPKKNKK